MEAKDRLLKPNVLSPQWTLLLEGVIRAIKAKDKDQAEIIMGKMALLAFEKQDEISFKAGQVLVAEEGLRAIEEARVGVRLPAIESYLLAKLKEWGIK